MVPGSYLGGNFTLSARYVSDRLLLHCCRRTCIRSRAHGRWSGRVLTTKISEVLFRATELLARSAGKECRVTPLPREWSPGVECSFRYRNLYENEPFAILLRFLPPPTLGQMVIY